MGTDHDGESDEFINSFDDVDDPHDTGVVYVNGRAFEVEDTEWTAVYLYDDWGVYQNAILRGSVTVEGNGEAFLDHAGIGNTLQLNGMQEYALGEYVTALADEVERVIPTGGTVTTTIPFVGELEGFYSFGTGPGV